MRASWRWWRRRGGRRRWTRMRSAGPARARTARAAGWLKSDECVEGNFTCWPAGVLEHDMAKVAKVKGDAVEAAQAQAPREMAWLEVHGQEGRSPAEPKLVQQAVRAWDVVKRIEELEEELKAIKEALAQAIGAGRSLVVPRVCRVSVAATRAVTVTDADKLRALLG